MKNLNKYMLNRNIINEVRDFENSRKLTLKNAKSKFGIFN